MVYTSGYAPIHGWEAKLITVGLYKTQSMSPFSLAGEIHLLPDWEDRRVDLGAKEEFHLNAFLCCLNNEWGKKLLLIPDGTHLFITGDIGHRCNGDSFPHLKASCWVDEFCVDPSNGTVAPNAAQLLVSSREEYSAAADLRFATRCPTCSHPTIPVVRSEARFCPVCER